MTARSDNADDRAARGGSSDAGPHIRRHAGGGREARARETEERMTDEERLSLLVSVTGTNPGNPARDARIPEDVPMSAGYVPGVPRLGVPALLMSDASLGVTNPGYREGDTATALPAGLAAGASFNAALRAHRSATRRVATGDRDRRPAPPGALRRRRRADGASPAGRTASRWARPPTISCSPRGAVERAPVRKLGSPDRGRGHLRRGCHAAPPVLPGTDGRRGRRRGEPGAVRRCVTAR